MEGGRQGESVERGRRRGPCAMGAAGVRVGSGWYHNTIPPQSLPGPLGWSYSVRPGKRDMGSWDQWSNSGRGGLGLTISVLVDSDPHHGSTQAEA